MKRELIDTGAEQRFVRRGARDTLRNRTAQRIAPSIRMRATQRNPSRSAQILFHRFSIRHLLARNE